MELLPELAGLQFHCRVVTHTFLPLLEPRLAAQVMSELLQEVGRKEGGEGDVVLSPGGCHSTERVVAGVAV